MLGESIDLGDVVGGGQFVAMALAVIEGEGIDFCKAVGFGDGQAGGAIQAATAEDDAARSACIARL